MKVKVENKSKIVIFLENGVTVLPNTHAYIYLPQDINEITIADSNDNKIKQLIRGLN